MVDFPASHVSELGGGYIWWNLEKKDLKNQPRSPVSDWRSNSEPFVRMDGFPIKFPSKSGPEKIPGEVQSLSFFFFMSRLFLIHQQNTDVRCLGKVNSLLKSVTLPKINTPEKEPSQKERTVSTSHHFSGVNSSPSGCIFVTFGMRSCQTQWYCWWFRNPARIHHRLDVF